MSDLASFLHHSITTCRPHAEDFQYPRSRAQSPYGQAMQPRNNPSEEDLIHAKLQKRSQAEVFHILQNIDAQELYPEVTWTTFPLSSSFLPRYAQT